MFLQVFGRQWKSDISQFLLADTFGGVSTVALWVCYPQCFLSAVSSASVRNAQENMQQTACERVDRKQIELLLLPATPPPLRPQTVAWFSHRPRSEHLTGIYEVMGNEVAAMLKIHNCGPVGNITPRI